MKGEEEGNQEYVEDVGDVDDEEGRGWQSVAGGGRHTGRLQQINTANS